MEAIFDTPVTARGVGDRLGRARQDADVVPNLRRGRVGSGHLAGRLDHRDAAQPRSGSRRIEPRDDLGIGNRATDPLLKPTMPFLHRSVPPADRLGHRKAVPHIVVQLALVRFHRRRIVPTLIDDLGGDRALAANRINNHNLVRERGPFEQQRQRRDLIGPVRHRLLSQHQALITGPNTDKMQRAPPAPGTPGSAHRLAVERLKIEPEEIEGVHCVVLSRPEELVDRLETYRMELLESPTAAQ